MRADRISITTHADEPKGSRPVVLSARLAPRSVETTLPRMSLLADLERRAAGRITLVRAPAGYGKTILLAQWFQSLRDQRQAVAWLTASATDRDPEQFAASLYAALRAAGLGKALGLEQIELRPDAFNRLCNALWSHEEPLTLIIDDAGVLNGSASAMSLQTLAAAIAGARSLMLSSREALAIDLLKERLASAVLDIDVRALSFTSEETAELARGSEAQEFAAHVHPLTCGWPAATALVFQSIDLRRLDKLDSTTLAKLGGPLLGEYFERHVLDGLPQELQRALQVAALLERFSGATIAAVAPKIDGWAAIEELCRRGLFVEPLDPMGDWYAVHPLLGAFLRIRLARHRPADLLQLHERATRWFYAQGLHDLALAHAVEAGDADLLEEVIAGGGGWRLALPGNHARLAAALSKIPEARVGASEMLSLTNIYLLAHGGETAAARRAYEALQASTPEGAGAFDRRLVGHLLGCFEDQVYTEHVVADISATIDAAAPGDWRSLMLLEAMRCFALPELGDVDEALNAGDRGIAFARRNEFTYDEAHLHYHEGSACIVAGRLRDAVALFSAGLEHAQFCAGRDSDLALYGRILLAEAALIRNDHAEARELLGNALERITHRIAQYPNYFPFRAAYLSTATLALTDRGEEEAFRTISACMDLARRRDLPRLFAAAVLHWVGALLLLGKTEEAAAAVAAIDLRRMPTSASVTRTTIAYEMMLARVCFAQGQASDAMRLLDTVSMRLSRRQLGYAQLEHAVLRAQVLFRLDRVDEAVSQFNQTLQRAAFEQLRRPFVQHGGALVDLFRVRAAARGRYGTNRVVDAFAHDLATDCQREERLARASIGGVVLSKRESELLALLCRGLANKEIARLSGMTDKTVKWHLRNLYAKLGVSSRQEAVSKAQPRRLDFQL